MSVRQTLVIYIPGHNDLERPEPRGNLLTSFIEELERIQTQEDVHILIQLNSPQDGEVKRYRLSGGQVRCVQTLREEQRGQAESLGSLLWWGQERYPAERYLLVVWNHGNSWNIRGFPFKPLYRKPFPYAAVARAMFSSTVKTILGRRELAEVVYADPHVSLRDFLDAVELKKALEGLETRLEILSLDGCLVNLLEVAYQIKDAVHVLVGSEDVEPQKPWMQGKMFEKLSDQADLPPEDLAKAWVEMAHPAGEPRKVLSALNLDGLGPVTESVDRLALILKTDLPSVYEILSGIRKQVQAFSNPNYIDLQDLAVLLKDVKDRADLKKESERLLASAGVPVLKSSKTEGAPNAQGIGIFYPENKRVLTPYYQKLDFALASSNWISFLKAYLDFTPRGIRRARI